MDTVSNNNILKGRIMRRIYLIWGIRLALHPTTLKVLIAAVFFWRSTKYVSYAHVIANMPTPSDLGAGYQFVKGAMFHAHPLALVLLSSCAWLGLWVVFDAFSRKQQEAWF